MPKFEEGSVIINKSGERRKVLGACGSVRFISMNNEFEIAKPGAISVMDLEKDGYVEEAPRWEPSILDTVWYIDAMGRVDSYKFDGKGFDLAILRFGNCFPTREAAQAARERVAKALKGTEI